MKSLWKLLTVIMVLGCSAIQAQQDITFRVSDGVTGEKLPGVVIVFDSTRNAYATDTNGVFIMTSMGRGTHTFDFHYAGYYSNSLTLTFPLTNTNVDVAMQPLELDEVIISTTRTNSRIEDLPIKVEVLGQEDMDEESTLVPGGIGSILGDLSVITIQKTNPVNGNDGVRMQGLDVQYTQMLRDGLPLYDGFSGSIGVLAIPPLDLKQVEIVKGASSTLYGGGAISGLINFISKTPEDSARFVGTINATTLGETNVNVFSSNKKNHFGMTIFAGTTFKVARDINDDGFGDVAEGTNAIVHPRAFYFSKKVHADVGLTMSTDSRTSGDIQAVWHGSNAIHPYLVDENLKRGTADAHFSFQINKSSSLNLKTATSVFDRTLKYGAYGFGGKQISSYSEVNYLFSNQKHDFVIGTNYILDDFQRSIDSAVHFGNYSYSTIGGFAQEDFRLTDWLALEGGIRFDHHSRYGNFFLPAAGIFIRPAEDLSIRLHYGTGYKNPGLFSLAQPEEYFDLLNIADSIVAERSAGYNMDINYSWSAGPFMIELNQAFYYTTISDPTKLRFNLSGYYTVENAGYNVSSIGTDSYIRMELEIFELYLGYNHTIARKNYSNGYLNLPYNPNDKLALTFAVDAADWRGGVEAAYNANQVDYRYAPVPDYWFFAAMIERKFRHGSIVLNCENLGDYRQSKVQTMVTGTVQNPVFTPFWGPAEGRVINLSLRLSL